MLRARAAKDPAIEWVRGDMLALPFDDASFDAATVGFGVRNVDDLEAGLRELRRVLRPGGRLGILEITTPRGRLAPFYRVWFDRVVPAARQAAAGRRRVHVSARRASAASRRRASSPICSAACGFGAVRYPASSPGVSWRSHVGEVEGA